MESRALTAGWDLRGLYFNPHSPCPENLFHYKKRATEIQERALRHSNSHFKNHDKLEVWETAS
jgi:hypothetical protein